MSYVALYREWRPQVFEDIVGQEHIVRTLQNALGQKRVAHAYLFCGPRGTGKTSTAKVLAKALNCLNPAGVEPCNVCFNCQAINDGSSMDVIEIDAASNRGVDEIRELREKIKFAPAQGKFKIYIVDEVHMLTTEAFNALLKTLEEPPGHVHFILATTEPHKIPATIVSRCQRFDFHRITHEDTIARLAKIAEHGGMKVSPEALALIARTAEGGLRDAVSTLDQCSSFGEGHVEVQDVEAILGMVGEVVLQQMSTALMEQDIAKTLALVQECSARGRDYRRFVLDLMEYLRNLLVAKVCQQTSAKAVEAQINQNMLLKAINLLSEAEREMKWATQPRILLEVALIKICSAVNAEGIDIDSRWEELNRRITTLEEALCKGVEMPARVPPTIEKQDKKKDVTASIDEIKKQWPEILETARKLKATTYAFLIEGTPLGLKGGTLELGFSDEYGFHKDRIEESSNRQVVETALKKISGQKIAVKCVFFKPEIKKEAPAAESPVYEALRLFGGEVVDMQD